MGSGGVLDVAMRVAYHEHNERVGYCGVNNNIKEDDDGVITITYHGRQTGETVQALTHDLRERLSRRQAAGQATLLLADLRSLELSDTTPQSSAAGREMLTLQVDRTAIISNSRFMGLLLHVMRFQSKGRKVRFFTTLSTGRRWLLGDERPGIQRSSVSLVSGLLIILLGLVTLLGWHLQNPYLMRWLPSLRPMNPLAAVGLVALGFGFICFWLEKLRLLKITGLLGIGIGIAALLPLHLDHILFRSGVLAYGPHADLADSAAWCFIAVGLTPFTVGTKRWFVRLGQYMIGGLIVGMALFNIFGQLYAHDFIYSLSPTFVTAFNLAVAFLMAGVTLVLMVLYRRAVDVLRWLTRVSWFMLVALLILQGITYASWSQAIARNKAESTQAFVKQATADGVTVGRRVQAYVDALYGFKGLFAASDFVDTHEFRDYYNTLNLQDAYPGLRAISFIAKVPEAQIPAFVAQQNANDNPIKIINKTNLPTHYIFTYLASGTSTPGTDLGSIAGRLQAFQKADATGLPVSSGTVQFAGSATQPATSGFFMTIPVSNKKSNAIIGYVNAVFNYSDFFSKTFSGNALDGVGITITDTNDMGKVFTNPLPNVRLVHKYSQMVSVADRSWNITVTSAGNFGLSRSQAALPQGTLISGQFFSLMILIIFVILSRGRRQALLLAERITADLHHERNIAVTNDQKSRAILSSIGDAVFAVDEHRRITLFNKVAERVSGYTHDEAIGKPYEEILKFVDEKHERPSRGFIDKAFKGHTASMQQNTLLVRKDGARVSVADSAAPIYDGKGTFMGVIVVFRDVSKEQALDRAKTEFVSLASHQLRTPLSAINWYSEMLLDGTGGKINKTQRGYLQEISEGNRRMVELVDSLLNVSRLEVGKMRNEPQDIAIAEMADSLHKEMEASLVAKQTVYESHIVPKLPAMHADPKLLRMIIQNLLSNAIKYTPEKGKVTLVIREAEAAEAQAHQLPAGHYMFISVQDTGYGIPKEQQDKIFQKLFRADNVRRMNVEGTGLGLYIVKEVAEKLGGTIWFDSIESAGTTFSVLIPIKTKES